MSLGYKIAAFDARITFILPAAKGNCPYTNKDTFLSCREHLDSALCEIASGFTCVEATGVWRGVPEPVLLYIVAMPQVHVDIALQALLDVTYEEEAVFVMVNGFAHLLTPHTRGMKDAA